MDLHVFFFFMCMIHILLTLGGWVTYHGNDANGQFQQVLSNEALQSVMPILGYAMGDTNFMPWVSLFLTFAMDDTTRPPVGTAPLMRRTSSGFYYVMPWVCLYLASPSMGDITSPPVRGTPDEMDFIRALL
jgi:hypothetical protein